MLKKIAYFFLLVLLASACRSSKELIYLDDAVNNENLKALPIQSAEHILKPSDILYISIKSMNAEVNALFNPESTMEVQSSTSYQKFESANGAYLYGYEVNPDASIKLPMLGVITIGGLSVAQAEMAIQEKADEFIKDAIVKVKLLNFKITVLGEVKLPGTYYNYNNSITILEAISMAGGNTDYSKIKKVMVVRRTADGNKSFLLDLSKKNVMLSEAYLLHPNDYVIVQPDKSKNLQLNAPAYSLFFSTVALVLALLTLIRL